MTDNETDMWTWTCSILTNPRPHTKQSSAIAHCLPLPIYYFHGERSNATNPRHHSFRMKK